MVRSTHDRPPAVRAMPARSRVAKVGVRVVGAISAARWSTMDAMTWVPPTECDQCDHPISEHVLWEPDEICDGWMHCGAAECNTCWHAWPKLVAGGTDST